MEDILGSENTGKRPHRKTKIIATLGPATNTTESILELIKAGVDLFRLNFSHGSHEEHSATLSKVRTAAQQSGRPIAILQDLSGPKIRITEVADGELPQLIDGSTVTLRFSKTEKSTAKDIYLPFLDPTTFLQVGNQILLADGLLELTVEKVAKDFTECIVSKGGRLRSRVGIAFPDNDIDLPATTEKDMRDLNWGIENDVDYVAISFVNSAMDVLKLRDEINRQGGKARLISKIERKSALKNIREIISVSDGLMVARGDLGLELPLEKVPRVQKKLIEQANFHGIPVIVATQVMHSMVTSVRPTRAEVSDIATAVMEGADAIMLSEETAIGDNPTLAVSHLSKIALEAESEFDFSEYRPRLKDADTETVPDAVAYAAAAAAIKVKADALIACTETGNSARLIAKYRPQQPLYGASSSERTCRRMCLYWGVKPIKFSAPDSHQDELESALKSIQEEGGFENGSIAVITAGLSVRTPGSTSVLEIKEMHSL